MFSFKMSFDGLIPRTFPRYKSTDTVMFCEGAVVKLRNLPGIRLPALCERRRRSWLGGGWWLDGGWLLDGGGLLDGGWWLDGDWWLDGGRR